VLVLGHFSSSIIFYDDLTRLHPLTGRKEALAFTLAPHTAFCDVLAATCPLYSAQITPPLNPKSHFFHSTTPFQVPFPTQVPW
jgi:hypothetical protein